MQKNMLKNILTVSKLNNYIKNKLEEDFILNQLLIQGEISNVKKHSSGHIYFTLKDSKASLNCVMFKSYTSSLKFNLENGMKIICLGYVSIYETTGQFQLYCEAIDPIGIGSLTIAFEQLKQKLEQKGYFDAINKKIIPKYPKCVAVITSSTGSVIEDIVKTIKRRNNSIKIILIPTLVQGQNAKNNIVESIKIVNQWKKADVIILGRGGGSIEDLWAFNEEVVADAIFNSTVPIISAVGHETDFTISDFTSDLRVSTPTAAGEIVAIPKEYLIDELFQFTNDLNYFLSDKLNKHKLKYMQLLESNTLKNPEKNVFQKQIYLEELVKKINTYTEHKLQNKMNLLEKNCCKLEALSPLNILKKGYCTIYNEKNIIQLNVDNINLNDKISINMQNGRLKAIIYNKE